jgi:hypothetical protein
MPTVDKLIVTNTTALRAKYGPAGVAAILQNVDALIKSDERRKLTTRLLDVSSPGAMRALDGRPVVEPGNPRQNKEAVDAAYRALSPDYIMILGSIDVIPHQDLKNALYRPNAEYDDDRYAWGISPTRATLPTASASRTFAVRLGWWGGCRTSRAPTFPPWSCVCSGPLPNTARAHRRPTAATSV